MQINIFDITVNITEVNNEALNTVIILGPSPLEYFSLPIAVKKSFNFLIPDCPFQKEPFFPIELFGEFGAFIEFYVLLIQMLVDRIKNPIIIYAHSALGIVALELALRIPEMIRAIINVNSTLNNISLSRKLAKKHFNLNFNPGLYREKYQGEYYKQDPSPRWTENERQIKLPKGETFEEEYSRRSAITWFNKEMYENRDGIAFKFWEANQPPLHTALVNQFYDSLMGLEFDFVPILMRGKIEQPVFFGSGLYDGRFSPMLDLPSISNMPDGERWQPGYLPPNISTYISPFSAHWFTEDPNCGNIICSWAENNKLL